MTEQSPPYKVIMVHENSRSQRLGGLPTAGLDPFPFI
jgi:hypothetical protein